jgi:hypothetical protein
VRDQLLQTNLLGGADGPTAHAHPKTVATRLFCDGLSGFVMMVGDVCMVGAVVMEQRLEGK